MMLKTIHNRNFTICWLTLKGKVKLSLVLKSVDSTDFADLILNLTQYKLSDKTEEINSLPSQNRSPGHLK
jgi:hypothetical protein